MFGRFIVNESVLRELSAAASDAHKRECEQALSGNGYEEDTETSAILEEAQYATISGAGIDLVESEKPKLLLVDDDQLLLRATRRVLKSHYHVLISTNPTEALMILAQEHVDALVSDYEIPSTKGGAWLLAQAKDLFPNVARILISSRPVPQEVLAHDAVQRFVHKNAGIDELVRQVSDCLA
ncbi:MAG TPA: response regulator [Polyangiaceae bacterium]